MTLSNFTKRLVLFLHLLSVLFLPTESATAIRGLHPGHDEADVSPSFSENVNNETDVPDIQKGVGGTGGLPVAITNTIVYFSVTIFGCFILYAHVMRPRILWLCGCGPLPEEEEENQDDGSSPPVRRRPRSVRRNEIKEIFTRLKLVSIVTDADFLNHSTRSTASVATSPEGANGDGKDAELGSRHKSHHRRNSSGAMLRLSDSVVQNMCAICLEAYEVGDEVVKSNNPKCPHAYHVDCLAEYFSSPKVADGKTPCPFCRQSFCIVCDEEEEASDVEEGNVDATDPPVISG